MDFELTSLEEVLEQFLPKGELAEVQRVLYGRPAKILELRQEAREVARVKDFELQGWTMPASPEETSPPRNVTIALVQHKVVLPTDAPVLEQVEANHRRVGELIETAGQAGANVVCLQEAWTMPYGLCTRERLPWTQFAENPETGASVTFLARLAEKHKMVIVSPILERVGQHIFVSIPIPLQRFFISFSKRSNVEQIEQYKYCKICAGRRSRGYLVEHSSCY